MEQLQIASDAINYEDVISRIKDIYAVSSPQEQRYFINILTELSEKGYSQTLEQLYLVDFKEVPVSIDRFLTDPYYLGETNGNGAQIYPGWWNVYHDVFDNTNDIYEVILSGATRIGKTSTAVSCMAYMTYLLMCYRNPQKYYGLKEISRATIAFANLTKELAEGVSFREYNDTLLKSPWFCLSGDTEILTDLGYIKLCDAANMHNLHIATMQSDRSIKYVTPKAIVKTKEVTELIEVELEDGTTIKGTPDHPVMLTDGAYKQLGELTENDDVMTIVHLPNLISTSEIWKPLSDLDEITLVSNLGRVYISPYIKYDSKHRKYTYGDLILSQHVDHGGYLYVELPQFRKKYKVHRLVAMAFLPNPENKPQVNHKDGNKLNNCVDNLEWTTAKENIAHAFSTGLRNVDRDIAECQKMSKINCKPVRCVNTREIFNSISDVAKAFNMTNEGIRGRILSGRPTRDGYYFEFVNPNDKYRALNKSTIVGDDVV